MFEVETSPTSHRQLDTRDALACMGKAEGGETESRVSDTEEARADRPGAQKAARRISPSPMATGFDMSSTGALYLAKLALKAWERSQG